MTLYENSVGLSFTTNPKFKGNHSIAFSGKPMLAELLRYLYIPLRTTYVISTQGESSPCPSKFDCTRHFTCNSHDFSNPKTLILHP